MMRLKSIIKTVSTALFILVPAYAGGQVPADMSAFMPSKAEIRKSLMDAGMTPDQIEQALNSMNLPEDIPANINVPSDKIIPCVDANENDICDTEESDPVITECRKVYQNELYTTASGLYGDTLGRNSVEIAQTCVMAAASATMTYRDEGGWTNDMDQLMATANYWKAVLSHGRYLKPGRYLRDADIPEMGELSDSQITEIISTFPRDMQAMMRSAGTGSALSTESIVSTAKPIHNKCQRIRSRVRGNYRNNVLVDRVCITHVPDTEAASE